MCRAHSGPAIVGNSTSAELALQKNLSTNLNVIQKSLRDCDPVLEKNFFLGINYIANSAGHVYKISLQKRDGKIRDLCSKSPLPPSVRLVHAGDGACLCPWAILSAVTYSLQHF